MKTVDAGETWMTQDVETPQEDFTPSIFDIDCPNDSLCYAISGKYIYKTTNGGGPMYEAWIEHTVDISKDSGIQKINVYPNPTTHELNITLSPGASSKDIISIYDVHGRFIKEQLAAKYGRNVSIDISGLSAGVYVLKYTGVNGMYHQSFVEE